MYRRIITGILIICLSLPALAQKKISFAEADRKTYALYLAQDWDSLIVVSRAARKAGYDTYFMRMRYGIALYRKTRYRQAASEFTGALSFNSGTPDALELLYYSLLMGGESGRSELITKEFKGDLAKKIAPVKGKFLSAVYAEGVFSYFDNSAYEDFMWNTAEDGEWLLSRTFGIGTLQLEHRAAPGITIRHSIGQLAKRDYYYLKDPDLKILLPDHRVRQTSYWLSPLISTRSGMNIAPVFNLTRISYETISQVSAGSGMRSQVSSYYTVENAVTGGLCLSRHAGNFDLGLSAMGTAHNLGSYYQGGASLTWYPFSNLSLYFTGGYQYKFARSTSWYPIGGIADLKAGFSLAKKVWVEMDATKGNMFFYLENGGSVLYNNTDYPVFKSSLLLTIPLNNFRTTLFIGGRFAVHHAYYAYASETDIPADYEPVSYNSYTLYSGIKWKIE